MVGCDYYVENILEAERRWAMCEGNFHFMAVVSKEIGGIYVCSQAAV